MFFIIQRTFLFDKKCQTGMTGVFHVRIADDIDKTTLINMVQDISTEIFNICSCSG